MSSHRELEALQLSVQVLSLSHRKSTAASRASGVGDTISFVLKANSGLGLKCRGLVWFGLVWFGLVWFGFKDTYFCMLSKAEPGS